jgi:hypothetical protein
MKKSLRGELLLALTSCALGACANVSPEPVRDHEVAPLLTLEDESADKATVGASECSLSTVAVTYVDDDSEDRGRIRVSFVGAGVATVEVAVEGAAPVFAKVESGLEGALTSARIQSARGSEGGDIAVTVRVQLGCGAQRVDTFLFEDPIKRCTAPELGAIEGHEADFYTCAERWAAAGAGCGDSGYLLGYGAHYASRFYFETRPRMGFAGQDWLDQVLVCLQRDLRDAISIDTSCADIRRIAFDQHPSCYVQSGFCTLPVRDILQVPRTIAGRDLLSRDGLRQVLAIVPACGREYQDGLFHWFRSPEGANARECLAR